MTHHIDLPEDVACRAEMLVASGRFASVEDVVRAGMETIVEIAEDESAASEAAWSGVLARDPRDPRDLTAREALACVGSDDPARRRVFDAHLDALCRGMDDGEGIETTPAELMARIRARLGVPPAWRWG
jgi:Arc/MetJ-type ribon-helix-helix transcriptional regulator